MCGMLNFKTGPKKCCDRVDPAGKLLKLSVVKESFSPCLTRPRRWFFFLKKIGRFHVDVWILVDEIISILPDFGIVKWPYGRES